MITKWIVESFFFFFCSGEGDCEILLGKEESKKTNSRIRESGSARKKKKVWRKYLGKETFGVYIINVSE